MGGPVRREELGFPAFGAGRPSGGTTKCVGIEFVQYDVSIVLIKLCIA